MSSDRIRVFLSSPMNSAEWTNLREALIALFETSSLSEVFELRAIEGYSGEPPKDIYGPLLKDSQIMVLLFSDEIRPGVKDEIEIAIREEKPIVSLREKGKKLSTDDDDFVKEKLYPVTTIEQFSSLRDLFDKIKKSLVALLVRKLSVRIEAEKLTGFVGASMKKTAPDVGTMLSFATFAFQTAQSAKALPMIAAAVDANPKDDALLLAKFALVATEYSAVEIPTKDIERLLSLSEKNEKAAFVLAALKLSSRYEKAFAHADIALWLQKDSRQWKAIRQFAEHAVEDKPEQTVDEVVEACKEIEQTTEALDHIEVSGIKIFSRARSQMEAHLQKIPVELTDDQIPGVPCCLNCMPRDSGEFVVLSRELGTLRDLLEEKLYDEYPGPEWCDYEFGGLSAICGHCRTELGESDEVYEDFHDPYPDAEQL